MSARIQRPNSAGIWQQPLAVRAALISLSLPFASYAVGAAAFWLTGGVSGWQSLATAVSCLLLLAGLLCGLLALVRQDPERDADSGVVGKSLGGIVLNGGILTLLALFLVAGESDSLRRFLDDRRREKTAGRPGAITGTLTQPAPVPHTRPPEDGEFPQRNVPAPDGLPQALREQRESILRRLQTPYGPGFQPGFPAGRGDSPGFRKLPGGSQAAVRQIEYLPVTGGAGGQNFEQLRGGLPMIGVIYRFGKHAVPGQAGIAGLTALYATTDNTFGERSLIARPGYAVGGWKIQATGHVIALQLIFMKLNSDGSLNAGDRYDSEWLGTPTGEVTTFEVPPGRRVIGIYGRRSTMMNAMGLIVAPVDG